MNIKSFTEFEKHNSKDLSSYLGQVGIATFSKKEHPYYSIISEQSSLVENQYDFPIILDSGFNVSIQTINENSSIVYNSVNSPDKYQVLEGLKDSKYSPRVVRNIRDLKKGFRFPVIASNDHTTNDYKTIGKLRNSGVNYSKFVENPVPKTRFKILSFKGEPISIIERINKFEADVNLNHFDYIKESKEICKDVNEKFGLDICNIEIIESVKGDLLIRSINTDINLNPLQESIMYEKIYEDFYECRLPNFVKDHIFEKTVDPYKKRMELDLKLVKSKHALDYSKLKRQ